MKLKIILMKNILDDNFASSSMKAETKLSGSNYVDMSNLTTIIGNAIFDRSLIQYLDELETVIGNLSLKNTYIEDLPSLERVDGILDVTDSYIYDLPSLKEVKDVIGNDDLMEYLEKNFTYNDEKYVKKNKRSRR